MNPDRWKQVDSLLQAALEQPSAVRLAFVREACAGDEDLEREVRSLLSSREAAGNFLEEPALEEAARGLASALGREPNQHTGAIIGQSILPFDINTDGVAEVGLLPDFIEDLRQQNVDINPLLRSAEAYVHMWERADRHCDFSPVTTATASPAARSTAITLTANQPAGWPVQSITYSVTGAQTIPPATISFVQIVQLPFGGVTLVYRPPVLSFPLSAPGPYTVTFFSTDTLGNSEAPKTLSSP